MFFNNSKYWIKNHHKTDINQKIVVLLIILHNPNFENFHQINGYQYKISSGIDTLEYVKTN